MRKKLAVFGLAALVLLAALLPVLHSTTSTTSSSRGGRVFKYTAIMSLQKEPPDDPWGSDGFYLLLHASGLVLETLVFNPSTTSSITSTLSLHPAYPMLSTIRIITSFSFASTTTTVVSLRRSGYTADVMYVPSRTYSSGVTYRWVITFSMYDTPTLKVMPFAIPRDAGPASSMVIYSMAPLTCVCTYTTPSQGSGTLSVSTSRAYVNLTHVRITYSISIPSGWDGRTISECTVYTTDSTILNAVNSRLGTSLSQLWFLYVAPNTTVYAGDMIVVEVWVVAPASV